MRSQRLRSISTAAAAALLLASCATPPSVFPDQPRPVLPPYLSVKSKLPEQPANSIRLYIYRPQSYLGRLGSAIILVNGVALADRSSPVYRNLLQPGSVFVTDTLGEVARITWDQNGRPEGTDKPIEISIQQTSVVYLRWSMKPTYGYLEQVSEQQASKEISTLGVSGYTTLSAPSTR